MTKRKGFMLHKWYLDGISRDGHAFIAYAAMLRLWGFEIGYTSSIVARHGNDVTIRSKLGKFKAPIYNNGIVSWESEALNISAQWTQQSAGVKVDLYETEDGAINWDCVFPKSLVHASIKGQRFEGLGYVEKIDMPIAPWTLPIQELRWGRYISEEHSVIWIDWGTPGTHKWVFYNSATIENAVIKDDEIRLNNDIHLQISEPHVIRQGHVFSKLATGIAKYIPVIKNIIPASFLRGTECKWLSKGTLFQGDSKLSEGWIIHEVVQFNNYS